jgi:hypothetical protein
VRITRPPPPLFVLERPTRRGEERVLEIPRAEPAHQRPGRLERQQPPGVQDPDPLREHLGLRQVVRAQQDRRVVARAHLADELLDLALGPRVQARGGLVE